MRTPIQYPFLLAVIVLATVLAGCSEDKVSAHSQPVDPEVSVITITPQHVKLTTFLAGRTTAHLVAEVRPQVGGIVQQRLFQEGGDVKAGQVLYQIDPATYQAAYDNARAALAKAEANALPAKLKAERYESLVKVGSLSKQENDEAQAAYQQSLAEVAAAKAALETARINLSYTRVTAPIAGRIGKSAVTPGALVTASQATALATVQQIDPIYVDVTQSSAELLQLKRNLANGTIRKAGDDGANIKLFYEDGSPYPIEGVLQFSDITVDQTTGVVTLRALFPNPQHDLLPGLYVRALLEEGVEENAILVPQGAVSRNAKGDPWVLLVKDDNTVEQRQIRVERASGGDWLVNEGLQAGDRVIVEGLQKVRPGARVRAVEAQAAGHAAQKAESGPVLRDRQPGQVQLAAATSTQSERQERGATAQH